jgi:hypothetical protein
VEIAMSNPSLNRDDAVRVASAAMYLLPFICREQRLTFRRLADILEVNIEAVLSEYRDTDEEEPKVMSADERVHYDKIRSVTARSVVDDPLRALTCCGPLGTVLALGFLATRRYDAGIQRAMRERVTELLEMPMPRPVQRASDAAE